MQNTPSNKMKRTATIAGLFVVVALFASQFLMEGWLTSAKDPKANRAVADEIIEIKPSRLSDLTFNFRDRKTDYTCAVFDSKQLGLQISVFKVQHFNSKKNEASTPKLPVALDDALKYDVLKTEKRMIGKQPLEVKIVCSPQDEDLKLMIASTKFPSDNHVDYIEMSSGAGATSLDIANCKKFLDDVVALK